MDDITKGTRTVNYVIDTTCIFLISHLIADNYYIYNTTLIYSLTFLVYYFILEVTISQTLGKLFTNTIVVDMHQKKPNFWRVMLRTALRLNPFDIISYLFGQEQGAHDLLSKTRLISKNIRN